MDIENQEEFDEKHEELCEKLKKEWNELSYGQIQKWVNMSLKYWLLFGGDKIANIEKNAEYFHIPIDSIIKEIAFGEKRNQADYKSWSKIENYDEYFEYQKTFRQNNESVAPIVKEFELFNNSNNKQ